MQLGANYDSSQPFVHLCAFDLPLFTGKERDTKTGLDDFGARYFNSIVGRFQSPDCGRCLAHNPATNLNAPFIHSLIVDEWETTNLAPTVFGKTGDRRGLSHSSVEANNTTPDPLNPDP